MNNQIIFNGKTYNSVEEMPAQERQAYEAIMGAFADKDRDRLPDILEGGSVTTSIVQLGSVPVFYQGRQYQNLDELPPEARARYEEAMRQLDKDGNGVPDLLEKIFGMQASAAGTSMTTSAAPAEPSFSSGSLPPSSPVMEPVEGASGKFILWVMLLVGLLCVAGVTLWVYLAQ